MGGSRAKAARFRLYVIFYSVMISHDIMCVE